MKIRVLVWNENIHEQQNKIVKSVYPNGIHNQIASFLRTDGDIQVETATLTDPNHGISADRLQNTDVLIWWGHCAHGAVSDETVALVRNAVWSGMGAVFLHSAHLSKPFKTLMGTPCNLSWREAGEKQRVWVISRNHPITKGLGDYFEIEQEEMYGEPFGVPHPEDTIFISWFEGGEVFRSGLTYKRGAGRIFYFAPGHEIYPTYYNKDVQTVITNAVHWAYNPIPRITGDVTDIQNVPIDEALETLEQKGLRLHKDGEQGYR